VLERAPATPPRSGTRRPAAAATRRDGDDHDHDGGDGGDGGAGGSDDDGGGGVPPSCARALFGIDPSSARRGAWLRDFLDARVATVTS